MALRLVGPAEVGEMLGGISRQRVSQLVKSPDFPDPVAKLQMGWVWSYDDVAAWAHKRGRSVAAFDATP